MYWSVAYFNRRCAGAVPKLHPMKSLVHVIPNLLCLGSGM